VAVAQKGRSEWFSTVSRAVGSGPERIENVAGVSLSRMSWPSVTGGSLLYAVNCDGGPGPDVYPVAVC
jgi:hypothetical protein